MIDVVSPEEARDILSVKKTDNVTIQNEVTKNIPLVSVNVLPSNFKGYPEGTKISFEPLTLGELEALNSGNNIDVARGVAMLLNSIHCNTLSPQDLYYWDVMYIGIQRKLLAFGETIGVVYAQCPECGEIIQKQFDYTSLEFKEIEAPDLPIIIEISGKQLEFGLITMKEFLEIDTAKGELDVYARMIKNLPYEEAYELVSSAYGMDAKKIKFVDKKLNYGIKPLFETCTKDVPNPEYNPDLKESKKNCKTKPCGCKVRLEVRSPFEVVFPEDADDRYPEFQVQYGRA